MTMGILALAMSVGLSVGLSTGAFASTQGGPGAKPLPNMYQELVPGTILNVKKPVKIENNMAVILEEGDDVGSRKCVLNFYLHAPVLPAALGNTIPVDREKREDKQFTVIGGGDATTLHVLFTPTKDVAYFFCTEQARFPMGELGPEQPWAPLSSQLSEGSIEAPPELIAKPH